LPLDGSHINTLAVMIKGLYGIMCDYVLQCRTLNA